MIYITTIAFNNPLFIHLQIKSFKLYILDKNYKFLVFDDSKDQNHTINIKNVCIENNIEYIRVDQNIHINRDLVFKNKLTKIRKIMLEKNKDFNIYNNIHINNTAGSRHADSVQFIFNYFIENIKNCKILFNIDSDMFLINELNITKLMNEYDIAYISQGYVTHIWPNVFIFDFEKCKNLEEICWDGCTFYDSDNTVHPNDVGGETCEYLSKYYNIADNKLKNIENYYLNKDINELFYIKDNIDNKTYNLLNKIFELNDCKYFNKEVILKYNDNFTILHLRGYTWTDMYINKIYEIDKLLSIRFSENN